MRNLFHVLFLIQQFALSASARKQKILTFEERVAVLKKVDSGNSCHWVTNELGVGEVRKMGYEELDKVVWKWFARARADNIPVSGKLIQEWALMYADQLGHFSFTTSNGWLEKWQKQHNVRMAVLSAEATDVALYVVSD